VKLSAQGEFQFYSDFSDLLPYENDTNPERFFLLLEPSFITLDDNNNIFITATRAHYLQGQIGNLQTGSYTLLKSDTLVMQLDGITGERLWSDDINGYLFGNADGVTSDFYYPLAMSIIDDQLQVTVRGFRGNYTGSTNEANDAFTYCHVMADWPYPLNACELASIANAHAKTIYFDLAGGKRRNGSTYNVDYPSVELPGANNVLYLIGDSSWEGIKHHIELSTQGYAVVSETGWVETRDSESAIYIEKHQLK